MGIATEPIDVLRFTLDRMQAGQRVSLVTLVGIEGSSSRALGNQMAVDETGAWCGSFSGGCVDATIVAEALEVIAEERGCQLRFGVGSPFIDIRLPCGGGLDLLFTPVLDAKPIKQTLAKLETRELGCLQLTCNTMTNVEVEETGWRDECFLLAYHPRLQVVVIGQGEELLALAKLARTFGADMVAITPIGATSPELTEHCTQVIETRTLRSSLPTLGDRWTAFVSLFHDRDWEAALLPQLLRENGFFHGAVGSSRTHAARIEALERCASQSDINRLRGSVGLIPSTRDPATLAISILSEVVSEYRQCACAPRFTMTKTSVATGFRN